MSIRMLNASPMKPRAAGFGHAHFWERALSRRQMLGMAAGAGAALAGGSLVKPRRAYAGNGSDPRPIPYGIMAAGQGWHVDAPSADAFGDISTVYDFEGAVAICFVQGTGRGRQGGVTMPLVFDCDMRFMKGRYRGMDGRIYRGTFGFI